MNTKDNILITIITPTYNRAELLKTSINSILSQSYQNWELLIVDDASIDNTETTVSEFGDERIRYFKLEENLGNAGARNAGVREAKGDFITFLDSDDEFLPDALESFISFLSNFPETNFAFGGYKIKDDETGDVQEIMWKPGRGKSFLEELRIGTGCGIFIRRTCFKKVGLFDENLRIAVDTDWLIRLNQIYDYNIIPDFIVIVHNHKGERVRKDKTELVKSYEIIYRKNYSKISEYPLILKKFLYKLQWLNYHIGRKNEGNKYMYQLVKNRIFSKKSIFIFLLFNFLPFERARKLHLKMSDN